MDLIRILLRKRKLDSKCSNKVSTVIGNETISKILIQRYAISFYYLWRSYPRVSISCRRKLIERIIKNKSLCPMKKIIIHPRFLNNKHYVATFKIVIIFILLISVSIKDIFTLTLSYSIVSSYITAVILVIEKTIKLYYFTWSQIGAPRPSDAYRECIIINTKVQTLWLTMKFLCVLFLLCQIEFKQLLQINGLQKWPTIMIVKIIVLSN